MGGTESILIYLISSFVFAGVIILKRESLPMNLRRPLALIALFLVISSFLFLIMHFFTNQQ